MEYLLENILNMVGFLVGLCIGLASYLGYKNTGSPVLFRMSVAFLSIAIGFFVIWMGYVAEDLILQQGHIDRFVQTLGIAIQTVGYFFIALLLLVCAHKMPQMQKKCRFRPGLFKR